ncbi:MAG: exonuclease [Planctomycetota bacterium]|nr:MAG: exonuclease [Planctomycetota bacterium]
MALGYNSCWFNFPSNEEWRLYDYFKDDAAYIDIETGSRKEVSVVGIYFRDKVFQFVSGINMDKGMIKKIIDESSMIVSFNGKSFDLPVLKRYFGDIFKKPHLDLMHAGRKVGLRGGLKLIEKEIGVKRDEEVCGMDGEGAVFLWDMYKNSGNREYLKKLLLYNEEDIVNLKPLAEHVYKELHESIKNKFFK